MNNINDLLKDVNLVNKNIKLAKIPGEDFNIFQTLGLKTDELSHSKFIAELLDPDGSHGMDSIFLEKFLDCIGICNFLIDGVEVRIERSIDYSKKYNSSGRIDIFLKNNKGQRILIENKIYASDQKYQLAKYKEAYPDATIIYLTLDGREPSELSTNGEVKTENISYKNKIIDWLEQCKEEVADFPPLLEPITQYINVLKNLTGQPRRKYMSDETIEVILKSLENVKSALEIVEGVNDIKRGIVLKHFVPAMKKLAEDKGLDFEYTEGHDCITSRYNNDPWSISLSNDTMREKELCIRFQFEWNNLTDLIYGFFITTKIESEARKIFDEESSLMKRIRGLGKSSKTTPWWPFYKKLYDKLQKEQLVDLASENSNVIKECEEKITDLLKLLEEFKAKG